MNHIPKHVWITFSVMILTFASSIAYERYAESKAMEEAGKMLQGYTKQSLKEYKKAAEQLKELGKTMQETQRKLLQR